MRSSLICLICSLFASAAYASAPELCGEARQGELLLGKVFDAAYVVLDGKRYPVTDDGRFLVSLARDAAAQVSLDIFNKDGTNEHYRLNVAPQAWDVQRIEGVPPRKVTPNREDEAEILREQKDVRAALTVVDEANNDWRKEFSLPLEGVISGHFGNQRIFNGIAKNPHSGTDIAAAEGTPVKAAGDGTVRLSGGNYFYGGNMVILDHGLGLQTIYMHLKGSAVQVGEQVKKGQIIGYVGKTGRATGPHLHWGASLNNVRFRPHSLIGLQERSCFAPESDGEKK